MVFAEADPRPPPPALLITAAPARRTPSARSRNADPRLDSPFSGFMASGFTWWRRNSAFPTGSELRKAPRKVAPGSGLFSLHGIMRKFAFKRGVPTIFQRGTVKRSTNPPAVRHPFHLLWHSGVNRPVLGAEDVAAVATEVINLDPELGGGRTGNKV